MAKEERGEAKALLEQISFMLLIDWDPIGVRHDVAEVKDEYDRVAARLISMINAGAEQARSRSIWSRSKRESSVSPAGPTGLRRSQRRCITL